MSTDDDQASNRRGIKSVETGLLVLRALASCGGPAALSAVAKAAGMATNQTHRYLQSLIAADVAKQLPGSGLYDLSTGAIQLGLGALARVDLFALADRWFTHFTETTGRTCLVAVWGDAGATVVRWFPGNPAVITSIAIGTVLPLLRSATGRVFYAYGDRAAMQAAAERALQSDRAEAPLNLESIRADVRAAGQARVDGTLIPGLRATAAPVFDLQGRLALVATALATPAFDISGDETARHALRAACRQVTQALGGPV